MILHIEDGSITEYHKEFSLQDGEFQGEDSTYYYFYTFVFEQESIVPGTSYHFYEFDNNTLIETVYYLYDETDGVSPRWMKYVWTYEKISSFNYTVKQVITETQDIGLLIFEPVCSEKSIVNINKDHSLKPQFRTSKE